MYDEETWQIHKLISLCVYGLCSVHVRLLLLIQMQGCIEHDTTCSEVCTTH